MSEKTNVTKELAKLHQSITVLQQQVRSIPQVSQANDSKSLRYLNVFWRVIVDLSALMIPAITIYLTFSNFISIPPAHSLVAEDPLTIPFVVQNNSLINLRNLEFSACIIKLHGASPSTRNVTINNYDIVNKFVPVLKANSSHTLLFPSKRYIGEKFTKIDDADIQIEITYKALFFTKKFKQQFRFVAYPTQGGTYEYYPMQPNS